MFFSFFHVSHFSFVLTLFFFLSFVGKPKRTNRRVSTSVPFRCNCKYTNVASSLIRTLVSSSSVQAAKLKNKQELASLTQRRRGVKPLVCLHLKCPACAAPGAGEGTSSGGDPTHPPRKKRARVDPTVESVS